MLILLLVVDGLPLQEALVHRDYFANTNEVALALFHTIFLDWPTRFFTVLDFLYRISDPPFMGMQQTSHVWTCEWLFHNTWENKEEGSWLRQAYQLHSQQFCSDQEATSNARTLIHELSSQLGLRGVTLQRPPEVRKQDMHVQPLPLPSKLVPFPWEDLPSVLCRATHALNLPHPQHLFQQEPIASLLHDENMLSLSSLQTYRLLGELLLLDEEALYQLTLDRLADPFQCRDRSRSVFGRSLLDINSRLWLFPETQTTSVCPRCLLEEEAYDRLYWRVHPVQVCPSHRIPLIHACPTCLKKIPVVRPHPFFCPFCQEDYRMGVIYPLSEQSLLYVGASLFSRAIGVPLSNTLFKQFEPSPLFSMNPKDYIHLLLAVGYEFLSDFADRDILRICNALQIDADPALSCDKSQLQDIRTRGEMLFHFLFTFWPVHFFAFFDELYRTVAPSPYQRFNYVMYQCRKFMGTFFIRDTFPWLWQAYEQHWYQFQQSDWYRRKREEEEDAPLAGIADGLY